MNDLSEQNEANTSDHSGTAASSPPGAVPPPLPSQAKSAAMPDEWMPSDDSAYVEDAGYYQHEGKLVAQLDVELPRICVRCGEHAEHYVKRKYASMNGKAILQVPFCEKHFVWRRRWLRLGWGCLLLMVICIVLCGVFDRPEPLIPVFPLIICALVFGSIGQSRTGNPSTVDVEYVWVKGLSQKFINQLPPFVD